jgi:hypothetical protein
LVGEHAFRDYVAADANMRTCGISESIGKPFGWESYHKALFPEKLPYGTQQAGQITICGNEQSHIKAVLERVAEEFYRDIHVGYFLVVGSVNVTALSTHDIVGKIVAVVKLEIAQCLQGLQKKQPAVCVCLVVV